MNGPGPTIVCASEDRRNAVADAGGPPNGPNGIDFLEVVPVPGNPPQLNLHFIFDVSTAGFGPDNFSIAGGERITTINVTGVTPHAGDVTALDLTIDVEGDFSDYVLILQQPNQPNLVPPGFDRQLRTVEFHFHLECPTRFDCAATQVCPVPPPPPVSINYLAKDYATFRQLMLDRMSLLAPAWSERNVADAGVALVELIAYAADRLSYRQDFNATEAYLATARLRTSVKRHVRLVDYDMHDGTNARTWVHIDVQSLLVGSSLAPAIPAGTRFVTALPGQPVTLTDDPATFRTIAQTGAQVFEALGPAITLRPEHNQMLFYNWSATDCCLPTGATQGTLAGNFPNLRAGDVLMLAEVRGPDTGNAEDADPRRRFPVCLVSATPGIDPLNGTQVTDITWEAEDALPFPLCIANSIGTDENRVSFTGVSAALGNMVMVDHGRTAGTPVENLPQTIGSVVAGRRFRPALPEPYLTFAGPNPYTKAGTPSADGTLAVSCTAAGTVDPTTSLPLALVVTGTLTIPDPLGGPPEIQANTWTALRSLFDPALADSPFAFVVEVETDGTAYLRFGDGIDGALPDPQTVFAVTAYRVGEMDLGNVGAETITHVMINQPAITAVTNPLPAAGGLAAGIARQRAHQGALRLQHPGTGRHARRLRAGHDAMSDSERAACGLDLSRDPQLAHRVHHRGADSRQAARRRRAAEPDRLARHLSDGGRGRGLRECPSDPARARHARLRRSHISASRSAGRTDAALFRSAAARRVVWHLLSRQFQARRSGLSEPDLCSGAVDRGRRVGRGHDVPARRPAGRRRHQKRLPQAGPDRGVHAAQQP